MIRWRIFIHIPKRALTGELGSTIQIEGLLSGDNAETRIDISILLSTLLFYYPYIYRAYIMRRFCDDSACNDT